MLLNSCLIELDQLYTRRADGSSREKAFNKILSTSSQRVSAGIVMVVRRAGSPEFDSRQDLFFFLSSLLFFLFSLTSRLLFSYCSFVLFLYIA